METRLQSERAPTVPDIWQQSIQDLAQADGEHLKATKCCSILLKDNTVDSFRINDLRTLPVFGTTQETTTLEQVVRI